MGFCCHFASMKTSDGRARERRRCSKTAVVVGNRGPKDEPDIIPVMRASNPGVTPGWPRVDGEKLFGLAADCFEALGSNSLLREDRKTV